MGKANEDYDSLAALAERLGLDEDEGSRFITSSMKRLGHKAKTMWEDGDPASGNDGGDFFSTRREARETRATSKPQRERRAAGGGWQYE